MSAPVVQSLEEIIAGLEPAYAQTAGLYNTQKAGLGQKYDAQRAAVEGKRVQGFDNIASAANSRGLDFWGIPIEEQSQYLADVYLPGMQQATNQQNAEGMQIDMSLAGLDKEKRLKATDTRTGQQTAYNAYIEAERERAFQAEQARIRREEEARQAEINRKYELERDERARVFQRGSSSVNAVDRNRSVIDSIAGGMTLKAGADGKVSPETYTKARNQALSMGIDAATFDATFRRFVNERHAYDYGYGTAPKTSGGYSSGGVNADSIFSNRLRF